MSRGHRLMRGLPTWSRRGYSAAWTARRDLPGEVLYVALGDSAAQGLGASRPELGYVGVRALVAARIIRDAAEARGLAVARLHRATEARRNQRARTDFALDMFHPNDAGYAVWASAFDDAVTARAAALVDGGSTGAGG